MTDNELLLAISNIIDPLRNEVQKIKQDVQGMKQDIQGTKQDVQGMKQDIQEMKQDIQEMKQDIQEMKQDIQGMKTRIKKIELTQENEILPRLNTIEACYISTYDRYRNSVEDHETMKQDISILKKVVTEHSKKLQKLA